MKLEEKQLPEMTVPDLEIQNFNKEIETQTNSENELPLSENLNLEIKSEKDQTEKLKLSEQIEDLNKKMDEMKELFSKKILSIDFEKETADRLHKELQEYKNDIYFKFIKPLIMHFIDMRESMRKNVQDFNNKTDEDKLKLLNSYIEEIQIILENNDIEIYETDKDIDKNVDMKKQKIIKKIETPYKELHGRIFHISSNGYMYKGRVISPEKVEVNIYKKTTEELKGE